MNTIRTPDKAGAAARQDATLRRARGGASPTLRMSRSPRPHRLAAPCGTDADVVGAQRLALAVLEDGIRATLGLKGRAVSVAWRRRELLWLTSDDRTEPFAFSTICDLFGIDADHLRARVLEAIPERLRVRPGREELAGTPDARAEGRLPAGRSLVPQDLHPHREGQRR
jgi:hypothetical protein